MLEQYTNLRIAFARADYEPAVIDDINARTNALQSVIWGHLSAIIREQPNPVNTSLMSALNDAFDMTTAERLAFELRLPPQIFWLLIGLTLVGMGTLGYQLALRGPRVRLLATLLTLTWVTVIVVILDLASARLGYIRTSTNAIQWTLQGFQGGVTIPPTPP